MVRRTGRWTNLLRYDTCGLRLMQYMVHRMIHTLLVTSHAQKLLARDFYVHE